MARNFPGTTGIDVDLGDVTNARFTAGSDWTFLAIFRIEDLASDRTIVSKWTTASTTRQVRIYVDKLGPVELRFNDTTILTTTGTVSTNTWYAIGVSHNSSGGTITVYVYDMAGTAIVNGETATHSTDASDLTEPIRIGRHGASSQDPFDGDICLPSYVDGIMTAAEIQNYSRAGIKAVMYLRNKYGLQFSLPFRGSSPERDISGNSNDGTINGASTIGDGPPIGIWYGADSAFSIVTEAGNAETLAAVAVGVATVNRQLLAGRTLSATATGIAAMTLALQLSRTLTAVATGIATLVATGAGQFARTLAATAIGVATLTTGLSLSRTLNATATGVATVARQLSIFKTLSATATGVATLAAGRLYEVTLSAIATGIATLTEVFTEAPEEPTVPFSGHAGIQRRSRWRLRRPKWKPRR